MTVTIEFLPNEADFLASSTNHRQQLCKTLDGIGQAISSDCFIYTKVVKRDLKEATDNESFGHKFVLEEVAIETDQRPTAGAICPNHFDLNFDNDLIDFKIVDEIWNGDKIAIFGATCSQPFSEHFNFAATSSSDQKPILSLSNESNCKIIVIRNRNRAMQSLISERWNTLYTSLNSLQETKFAYVFGVVVHFEQFRTKEGQLITLLSITDDSMLIDNDLDSINCVIKCDVAMENCLPMIKILDIVRLHRVSVSKHQRFKNFNCYARLGYYGFRIHVFSPKYSDSAGITYEDQNMIKKLNEWTVSNLQILNLKFNVNLSGEENSKYRTFSTFSNTSYADICVLVISTAFLPKQDCYVLRVTDGTLSLNSTNKMDRLESEVIKFLDRNEKLDSIPDKYLVDIFVYGREFAEFVAKLKAGDYVELKNLHLYSHPTYYNNRKFVMHENRNNKPHRCMAILTKWATESQTINKRIAHLIDDL